MLAEVGGVALVLVATVALAARGPPDEYGWATFWRAQDRLWLLAAGLLAWLFVAEGAGLASLNHPPVDEFAPSAALAFVAVSLTGIASGLVMRRAGSGTDPSTRALLELPRRRALPLVASTGVAEELVFRGYLVTRASALAGSEVAAVAVSAAAFTAFRVAGRDRGQVAQVAVLGVAIAAAFAHTGNLLAVVVARVAYDGITTATTDPADLPNE